MFSLALALVLANGSARAQIQDSAASADTTVVVRHGQSLLGIAAQFLESSQYFTTAELVAAMRHENDLQTDRLLPGQSLQIPLRPQSVLEDIPRIVDPRPAHGIYATATTAGSPRMMVLADSLVAAGGNTMVFEVKDRAGDLSYVSSAPLAQRTQVDSLAPVRRPTALVSQLHRRGLHVVARLTCFYDERMATARPDLAPRMPDGTAWDSGWLDPSKVETQDYLLDVVDELVSFGVDEVQLDYVRFPTENSADSVLFDFADSLSRHVIVTDFVRRVRDRLAGTGVLLAADVFGVAAWGHRADRDRLGQHLPDLLPLLDVVCPMLYPSHFYGNFLGMTNPVEYPYFLVSEGVRRLLPLAQSHGVAIRPWVQSFPYRIANFDEAYVAEQMQGAAEAGADGCMLWNPASRYKVGIAAMRQFIDGMVEPSQDRSPQLLGVRTEIPSDM